MAAAKEEALDALAGVVRASGLVDPGSAAVVMTSGGPDSACAAAGLARLLGPANVHALHVNYGLRSDADRDERACRELCGRLRIDLHVERPGLLRGNLQAAARRVPFEDDVSNLDPAFARNRIRAEVMPVLAELGAAETNIAETHAELVEEAELLDRLVLAELEAAGSPAGSARVAAAALERFEPGLRRLALRALAERASGRAVGLGRARASEIARLAASPQGGVVELGGGGRAICEARTVRFEASSPADAAPEPTSLRVPGTCRVGRWEIRAELHPVPVDPAGPELATLDAARLGGELEVRTWRRGDRIRPLGMRGTKSLQDLFTDRGVPRSARREVPVVLAQGRVAWVAGVAVSEDFRLAPSTRQVAVLTCRTIE